MSRLRTGGSFMILLVTAACPGGGGNDAGPADEFEPTLVGDGTTLCGDIDCQAGQSCREENLCYLGCERDLECAVGEYCDESNPAGGRCVAAGAATCGDLICDVGEHWGSCPADCDIEACDVETQGTVPCGEGECGPGTYCANPAEGSCYAGCLSSSNCVCGQRCNTVPGAPGDCTAPITPDLPTCPDGTCDANEAPQNCPEDCPWLDNCFSLCSELVERMCLLPTEGIECNERCDISDDSERESFGFCIFASGGPAACPTACVEQLDALPPPP